MRTHRISDLYLPPKLAYHIKIFIGGILVSMFFNWIWRGNPFAENFFVMVGLVFVQLEIFFALSRKMFVQRSVKTGKDYKSKIIKRLILFYLLAFAIAIGFLFFTFFLIDIFLSEASFKDIVGQFMAQELKRFLTSWFIGISLGSLIFFYFEWTHSLKREQKLREEKLIFQYETLKNQVNPHFLFNSLNTLSSLVSKDPELSERFISKFSHIYRYILENKDREMVRLDEELKFIEDYFFLQKIRDNGKIDLQIDIDQSEKYEILPISLQLLVENAIKHNAATLENPLKINITLNGDQNLTVTNNLKSKMHLESSSKIGLKNLGERISLVMNREMRVIEEKEKFIVELPIRKTVYESSDR